MNFAHESNDSPLGEVLLRPNRRDLLRMSLASIVAAAVGSCSSLSPGEEIVNLGLARVRELSSGDVFDVRIQQVLRRKRLEWLALNIQSPSQSKESTPSLAAIVRGDAVERVSAQLKDPRESSEFTLGNLGLVTLTMGRSSGRRQVQGTLAVPKLQRNFEFDYETPGEEPAPIIVVVVPVVIGVLATWGVIVALVTAECTQSAKDVCGEGKVKSVETDIGWFSSSCDIECK